VQAAPAAEPTEQVALRGANTEMAAKPMRPEKTRVAAAPVSLQPNAQAKSQTKSQAKAQPEPKPQRVAAQPRQDSIWDQAKPAQRPEPAKPTAVAKAEPVAKHAAVAKAEPPAKPQVRVAAATKTLAPAPAREPEIRTAYSGTTTGSGGGLLTGAQPVVPAGSFNSFR
jgi:hypothetical protein